MARLLNATGYVSSILAAVCLVLALVAAPIGELRGDEPVTPVDTDVFGNQTCNLTCNDYPQCTGSCKKKLPECEPYRCVRVYVIQRCECSGSSGGG
jgi:hypothetical protein